MGKIDIKSLTRIELGAALAGIGEPKYRATQVFRWLYRSGAQSFADMTDLPAEMRSRLEEHFHITRPALLDMRRSRLDGTAKYLLKLEDAATIEAVFLSELKRNTICLSTQVGCRFGCNFCASAPFGFKRNLTSAEIIDEVLFIRYENSQAAISNIVFMGIGEPFDNYDNLMKAIRVFNDPDGLNIGARKMTISTCGIIPGIRKLASEELQVELSVSLHASEDSLRSKLVPINKRYPITDLIASCKEYIEKTNRVITFEYILIKGVNSSREDALRLARLLKGMKCKVNTITFNQIKAMGYMVPTAAQAREFSSTLESNNILVTHRKSKGEDIDAGCGQLRISNL